MKEVVFPYTISFGKNDDVELEIEFALSDDEAQRLAQAAKADQSMNFVRNQSVQDIYESVFSAILDAIKEDLRDDPSPVEDMLSWEEDDDPDQPITEDQISQYLDELYITINYPEET